MESTQALRNGALLHDTYRIERVLGQGGFGITYLAYDTSLDIQVAVKEFFPKTFCARDGATSHVSVTTADNAKLVERFKQKFLKEAKSIAKLNHPNIIKIHTAFEENGTAYYVMQYVDGRSLSEEVRAVGPLTEARALRLITQVGRALEYIHSKHITHLDVKPGNIMLRRDDDTPILIDFGLAKQYDDDGQQTSSSPVGVSHGFAPIEQYKNGGVGTFSPVTDVYSLGATLYFLLSGVVPPQAPDLIDAKLAFPATIPPRLVQPIAKAMSVSRSARYQSVDEFLRGIEGDAAPAPSVDSGESTLIGEQQPARTGLSVKALLGVCAVVVVALLTVWGISRKSSHKESAEPDMNTFVDADSADELPEDEVPLNDSPEIANSTVETAVAKPKTRSYTANGVTFEMVVVDGGTFRMGWDNGRDEEKPAHKEQVASFAIGKTEVTQALWEAVMGKNPSYYNNGGNYPVENVRWTDCQDFISKLNALTGKRFRLPTEAEWEYAARGGNRSKGYTYSGSDDIGSVAWYRVNSKDTTRPVAGKEPNELGLYDMSGNVWEWTADKWSKDYSSPRSSSSYVARGGGIDSNTRNQYVVSRCGYDSSHHTDYLGLRLALDY